ncbi:MAG: ribonuclease P protein component [Marinifilaceae bacterium]
MNYTFSKDERLCSRTALEQLMRDGQSFVAYPFRIVYSVHNEKAEAPAQLAISVGKKRFKRAVKRNAVKRMVREVYRMRKHKLYNAIGEERNMQMLLIYLDSQLPDYDKLGYAMDKLIEKIAKRL